MIRTLFKVERGTIVHFLKWGAALAAFIIALWLGLMVLRRAGAAATRGSPLPDWAGAAVGVAGVVQPAPGENMAVRLAGGFVVVSAAARARTV